jgi:hypothetical protein
VSLREQLEAKARRRCVVPVPVQDTGPARRRLEETATALAAAGALPDLDGALDSLRSDLADAQAALDACSVDVVLIAPVPAEAEAILSGHLGEDGAPDYTKALPHLLALCADDESLRDVEWWQGQLARPEWTIGERSGLVLGVMYLVADGVRPLVPKD